MGSKNQKLNKVLIAIIKKKKQDLIIQKKEIALSKMKDFVSNLDLGRNKFKESILNAENIALIAEIKLASPAEKDFKPKVEIMDQAGKYDSAGADAISYITETHYFNGEVERILKIGAKTKLPILQKDFVIDQYQIYEAKIVGSSALLLIAKILDKKSLSNFVDICLNLHIEPVVEINDESDLENALETKTSVIAVNSRNLDNFEIDLNKAYSLLKKIPDKYIKLGFSGIDSSKEVKKYKTAGAKGVLIGTSLMKAKNIKEFIKEIKSV